MRWNSSRKDPQNQSANFLVASGHKLASNYRWLSFWIVPCPSNPVNMALLSKCIIIENYLHQLCVYLAGWAREKRKIHPQGKFWLFTKELKVFRNAQMAWKCAPQLVLPAALQDDGFFIGHCCVDPDRQVQQCTTVGDIWTWTLARGFLKVGTKSQTEGRHRW